MSGVTVVAVGHNDGESLAGCVEALMADPDAGRIIVVDNASTDETGDLLEHLDVESVRNEENLGYAGAVNGVLTSVDTEYLAVINVDTVPTPGWLAPQIECLDEHRDVAATSPTVTLADDGRLNAAGLDIHVTGLAFNRLLHADVAEAGDVTVEVPGLQGTAFVIRTALLREQGGCTTGASSITRTPSCRGRCG